MILTTHFTVGAALGGQFSNPFLASGVGFLSHFLIDIIPHHCFRPLVPWTFLKKGKKKIWDFSWPLKIHLFGLINFLSLLALTAFIFIDGLGTNVFLAGFFGVFPDLYEWTRYLVGKPRWLPTSHFLHNENSKSWNSFWGVLIQIFVFGISFWGLVKIA